MHPFDSDTVCRIRDLERAVWQRCRDLAGELLHDCSLLLPPTSLAESSDFDPVQQESLLIARRSLEVDLLLPRSQLLETADAASCFELDCLSGTDSGVLVFARLREVALSGSSLLPGEELLRLGLREGDTPGCHLAGDADRLLLMDLAGLFFEALRLTLRERDALGCHLAGDLDPLLLVVMCE